MPPTIVLPLPRRNRYNRHNVPYLVGPHKQAMKLNRWRSIQLSLSARNCPACLERFETHPYCGPGNVVIDSCRDCELTWLDHGELATIMRAPGQRPSPDSSPVVPTDTHIPTDPVAEALTETTKFVIRNALRYMVVH